MVRLVNTILVLGFLSGCTMGVENTKYKFASSELNESNSGIVIGSEASGAGISFMNLATKEKISYNGAAAYCIRLPIGRYSLNSIGTPYGSVSSKDPFTFTVSAGQRHYIGAVVSFWLTDEKAYIADQSAPHAERGYTMPLLIGSYKYSVFNRFDEISDRYKKDCPSIDRSEIVVSLME